MQLVQLWSEGDDNNNVAVPHFLMHARSTAVSETNPRPAECRTIRLHCHNETIFFKVNWKAGPRLARGPRQETAESRDASDSPTNREGREAAGDIGMAREA